MAQDMLQLDRVVLDYPERLDGTSGPNDPQKIAHVAADHCEELLYGGAAGGGKTAFLIAEFLSILMRYPGATAIIFRRTYDQLIELGGIAHTLSERIPPSLGTYNKTERIWTFANGSMLRLSYLATDADCTKYQGGQYIAIGFDQVEQMTEYQYTYMLHRLRTKEPKLMQILQNDGYKYKAICTANPAGVGHAWVKRRWITPHPKGKVVFRPEPTPEQPKSLTRCFIPARVFDNAVNLDPSYIEKLEQLPEDLRRAMLYGDWDVYTGQKFKEFRTDIHVRSIRDYPLNYLTPQRRAIGIDYGMEAPFCALWGAKLPDGLIVVYRELYRNNLTPEEQAKLILNSETPAERMGNRTMPAYLDPSCWARSPYDKTEPDPETGVPTPGSIAGGYYRAGLSVNRAWNHRLPGVARVHDKLRLRDDGQPRLIILDNCVNLIRTLPDLTSDDKNPEDVDTDCEDHAYDALRYLLFALEPMSTDHTKKAPQYDTDAQRRATRAALQAVSAADRFGRDMALTGIRGRRL